MMPTAEVKVRPLLCLFLVYVTCGGVNCLLEFDFIVVGAGAGGGAVSRRLAENGRFSVLLIESGGLPKPGQDIPVNAPNFLSDPDVTFNYQSIPQENAALRSNGIVSVVSGREIGGSTSINYLWFNRGSPYDWDHWAKVTGDDSWKYENMLKYFKRSEDYKGDFPSDQHGFDGPITVSRPKYAPGLDYWLAAGKELGYPLGDPNGPQKRSFTPVEFAKRRGRRVSSYIGYLNPILDKPNFQIMTNTNVTQIIFRGKRAVGVHFISNGTNPSVKSTDNTAYATKEIIISAGAYQSPLLLQRSGIGPADLLRAAKIPIVQELPTGLNFQDHPAVNLNFIVKNISNYIVMDEDRELTPENWRIFNLYGDGPYSSTRGATGQGLMTSSVSAAEGNFHWPDIQLCMSHSTRPYLSADILYMTALANVSEGEVPMSSSVFMGRPRSRGSIKINPDNVLGDPILDVGYLRDVRDLQIFLDGIRETLKIFEETDAYKPLKPRYAPVTLPGCARFPVKSKDYWICYIRHVIQGGCHPAGTNKMGRHGDPSAVVDNELRVIGVDGLRVVDASVMPFIVNANPHAAVYGIAEKAADLILKRWSRPPLLPELNGYYGFSQNVTYPNPGYPLDKDVKPHNEVVKILGYPLNQVVTTPDYPLNQVDRTPSYPFNPTIKDSGYTLNQDVNKIPNYSFNPNVKDLGYATLKHDVKDSGYTGNQEVKTSGNPLNQVFKTSRYLLGQILKHSGYPLNQNTKSSSYPANQVAKNSGYPLNNNIKQSSYLLNHNAKHIGNLFPVNNIYSYPFIPHYDHSSHFKGHHLYHHQHLGELHVNPSLTG